MIKWNEVTWYSKLGAAIVLFGVLPVLSFYIGTQYREAKEEKNREYQVVKYGKKDVNNKLQDLSEEKKQSDLSESDLLIKTSPQGVVLYNAPYKRLVPTNEITTITPNGTNKTFSRDNAILAARYKGFFRNTSVVGTINNIKLQSAVETGAGEAWFTQEVDRGASTDEVCPARTQGSSNIIIATFEMNTVTGQIIITNKCSLVPLPQDF